MATKVENNAVPEDDNLLGLHSEWVGDSQMRLRVRKLGKTDKVIVDVTELSHKRICRPGTALRVARNFVRQFGVVSVDATMLRDTRHDKQATTLDGKKVLVKIRQSSFVFQVAQ
jgi:hypothetical protein